MTPKLNNVEDGYYHNLYLLNSTNDAYDEIRTLIGSGGGGGGVQTVVWSSTKSLDL